MLSLTLLLLDNNVAEVMIQDEQERTKIIGLGKRVLQLEAAALKQVEMQLTDEFATAVLSIANCAGKVICSGMGKAGLIAQKIASTLASTGIPAFFLHPADAMHGDLGMATPGDVALLFSNSGESDEVVKLLPYLFNLGVFRIALTASRASSLGRNCELTLPMGILEEACPLQLAPSSSTTALLALGDALALAALELRGFTTEEYARLHPGGSLGRMMSRVEELMRTGERCPTCSPETKIRDVVSLLSKARAGLVTIVDEKRMLLGVFTDGDFRRHWSLDGEIGSKSVSELMTRNGQFVRTGMLVREAKHLMAERHINALPVVDQDRHVVGLLDLQDIV